MSTSKRRHLETPYRLMRHSAYREAPESRIREDHVAPINLLVDELREQGRGFVPYVAPTYGGISAKALFIFRDPGPATRSSGMLCHQNNDQSAQRFSEWLESASIAPERIITWNAYPWYINGKPSEEQLRAALSSLNKLLTLLVDLQVVVLCGRPAEETWQLLLGQFPERENGIECLSAPHTSHMGLLNYNGCNYGQNIEFAKKQFALVAQSIGGSC